MTVPQVLEKIHSEQESFSKTQKIVAGFVTTNFRTIPFLTITALAEKIGVSENSVIQFCKRLGFERFSEFKKVFAEYALDRDLSYRIARTSEPEFPDFLQAELDNDFRLLTATLNDEKNRRGLKHFSEMLDKADHVYVLGARSSAYMAGLLARYLRHLEIQVHDISCNPGDTADQICMITPRDLLIVFSLPSYTRYVVEAARLAKERGAQLILITDTGLSPAELHADLVFRCAIGLDDLPHNDTACFALVHALCCATVKSRGSDHQGFLNDILDANRDSFIK